MVPVGLSLTMPSPRPARAQHAATEHLAGGNVTDLDRTHTGSCSECTKRKTGTPRHGRCAPCRSRRQLCSAKSVLLELGIVGQGARSIVLLAAGALLEISGASIGQSKIGWPPIRCSWPPIRCSLGLGRGHGCGYGAGRTGMISGWRRCLGLRSLCSPPCHPW